MQFTVAQSSIDCSALVTTCSVFILFQAALPFLDADITDISKEGGHYDAKHFLLYFYYGGMIYTALKQYTRALYFFETVSIALAI